MYKLLVLGTCSYSGAFSSFAQLWQTHWSAKEGKGPSKQGNRGVNEFFCTLSNFDMALTSDFDANLTLKRQGRPEYLSRMVIVMNEEGK